MVGSETAVGSVSSGSVPLLQPVSISTVVKHTALVGVIIEFMCSVSSFDEPLSRSYCMRASVWSVSLGTEDSVESGPLGVDVRIDDGHRCPTLCIVELTSPHLRVAVSPHTIIDVRRGINRCAPWRPLTVLKGLSSI